mmetsp:Transcript_49239/g.126970  ORF Transcript_49239/g.126970 Transcript_49239/m.126970 type:complete len:213 (+) Transcript_49239:546-1184(+)
MPAVEHGGGHGRLRRLLDRGRHRRAMSAQAWRVPSDRGALRQPLLQELQRADAGRVQAAHRARHVLQPRARRHAPHDCARVHEARQVDDERRLRPGRLQVRGQGQERLPAAPADRRLAPPGLGGLQAAAPRRQWQGVRAKHGVLLRPLLQALRPAHQWHLQHPHQRLDLLQGAAVRPAVEREGPSGALGRVLRLRRQRHRRVPAQARRVPDG